jgi:hypothetical protein
LKIDSVLRIRKSARPIHDRLHPASTAALSGPFVAPQILAKSVAGANDKLNIAWVGFGNQGGGDLNACSNGNNMVALADCDPNVWGKRKAKLLKGICFLPAPPPVTIGPGMEGVHSICHKNSSFERGCNNILIHSSMGIAFKVVG